MSNPTVTLYGIPNCDTVKRARAWLAEHGVPYAFHDYKKQGVPAAELARWMGTLGWEPLVNRKGTAWRKLDASAQASVVNAQTARALLVENASVIKRPVVDWGSKVTVGFDPADWEKLV